MKDKNRNSERGQLMWALVVLMCSMVLSASLVACAFPHPRLLSANSVGTGNAGNTHVSSTTTGGDGMVASSLVQAQEEDSAPMQKLDAKLPTPRYEMSAVWTGEHAYIFGGIDASWSRLDDVVRFNPTNGSVETLDAKLPTPRSGTSAVWTGEHAYIFAYGDVVRFNTTTGSIETLDAKLPTPRDSMSAVWAGEYAYIFGGATPGASHVFDDIVRFNPEGVGVLKEISTTNYIFLFLSAMFIGILAATFIVYKKNRSKKQTPEHSTRDMSEEDTPIRVKKI